VNQNKNPGTLSRILGGAIAATVAVLLAPAPTAYAHETDQYTLPVGRDFADLGPYLSRIVHGVLTDAVAEANAAISLAIDSEQSSERLAELHSPEYMAGIVWARFFLAVPTNELLDTKLLTQDVTDQYPGLVTMYRPIVSIYDDPLLVIDLSKFVRTFFRAGTVDVGGTLFGTDKLIHFINVGRIYHVEFESRMRRGQAVDEAMQGAIRTTAKNPLTSEDGMLGMFTTGIHSNGDLAADYAGLLFYRNLTAPVRVGKRELPPMLVRDGAYWRVQARADSDFFTAFITPHWNEVLNPNRYARYFSARLGTVVADRCTDALDHYRDEHDQLRTAAQFEAIARELSTYYGDDYGYATNSKPVSLATVCFARSDPAATGDPAPAGAPDALGRSPLWWAARHGDVGAIRSASSSDVNAQDADGETPLHAAVRSGDPAAVAALLALAAKPDVTALYGTTPLMLSALTGQLEVAAALLRGGADPNRRDLFGQAPLLAATARGNAAVVLVLLEHHADLQAADDVGNTALHLAARRGDAIAVSALLAHGADRNARNARAATAREEAERAGHAALADRLARGEPSGRLAMSAGGERVTAPDATGDADDVPTGEPVPR